MKPTLDTIAQTTGFSKSTVSRVLSGKAEAGRIPKATAVAIFKEAERIGYTHNRVAKKMRSQKSHNIGLVVPSIANPFFADITSSVVTEARKLGYTTIVADTQEDATTQNSSIASLLTAKVAGIIIAPCGEDASFLEQVNNDYIPIVLIDRYYDNSTLPYVTTNNYKGAYNATMALIRNGHKNIACIQGTINASPNKKRVEGYLSALSDAGLAENAYIVGNEFSINNGYLETTLLLQNRAKMPTAIFALSNTIGLGVIKAIRESGYSVPEDISVISYDNNMYLDHFTPAITRISQLVDEMGRMAVKLLSECISGKKRIASRIELSPDLILRDSISAPRNW